MKNLILIATLVFSISILAQHKEQRSKSNDFSPEEMATLQSKRMTLNLDLTESQQNEVHQVFLKKLNDRQVKRDAKNNSTSKPTKADKFKRMNASLDQKIETKAELKSILNEAQYKKWEKSLKQKKRKSGRKLNN
ncbi:MAG: hypothetical protein KC469_09010 [Flavobacteriaceae bacterium]|jgi:hypothetical protein|nr:hypothetical protein [Flavobacteriaceae bacterium]